MRAVFVLFVVISLQKTLGTRISQSGVCSFRRGLEEINLLPLASEHVVKAVPRSVYRGLRDVYWNPCSPVSRGSCSVAVCGRFQHNRLVRLASQYTAHLVVERDSVYLEYATNTARKVSILLSCSKEEGRVYIDKNLQQHKHSYVMTLSSRHACWSEVPTTVHVALPTNTTTNITTTALPTPPSPGVVTVTSRPDDGPTIAFLLLVEVLATILILLVLLSAMFAYLNYRLKHRHRRGGSSPPAYHQLYLDDDELLKL